MSSSAIMPPAVEPMNIGRCSLARRRFQRGCVDLQNGKWTGRFLEDFRGADGNLTRVNRRIFLGTLQDFPTKKLAMRQLEPYLAEVNGVNYRPKTTMTLREFIPLWEPIAKPKYKPGTWKNFQSALRTLLPCFGHMPLSEIETEAIERFMVQQTTSGSHVRNLIKCLRAIWRTAKKWKYVKHDPFVDIESPALNQEEPRFFTESELLRILVAAPEPYRTLYWLLAQTAIRIGEALALTWDLVDIENEKISIRASVWCGKMQLPKTANAVRTIPISPKLANHLYEYRQNAQANPLGLLFPNTEGNPVRADWLLLKRFQPLLEKLNIPRAGFHAFRHTSASLLDRMHAPIAVREQRMGHSSFEMTKKYTHVLGEDARRVAAQFDEVLFPSNPSLVGNTNEVLELAAKTGS